MTPLLSIVTVTYDDNEGLASTVHSIASQINFDPSEVEMLIIDGANQPSARSIAGRSGILTRYVGERDAGVYDAMNKGTYRAHGKYVHYLNSGDFLRKSDSLSMILNVLRDRRPTWLVVGALHLFGGMRDPVVIQNQPHIWLRHALGQQPHCHQATIFDRSALIKIGAYDLDAGIVADYDLILRFGLLDTPASLPDVLIGYEGGGVSAAASRDLPKLLAEVRERRLYPGSAWWRKADRAYSFYQRVRLTLLSRRDRLMGVWRA